MLLIYLLILLLLSCAPGALGEVPDRLPLVPCGEGEASPDFAPVGAAPNVRVWHKAGLRDWVPASCLDWSDKPASHLVETAGRFEFDGTARQLLARFAAVSALEQVRYWSVTRGSWQPLFDDAHALGADGESPRDDFRPDDLVSGVPVLLYQKEAHLAGEFVMQLEVQAASEARLVVAMQNVSAVRWLLTTLIKPGDYEFFYLIEREREGVFRYYNLSRVVGGGLPLALLSDASFINRAVAVFRHLAGYPTDAEPPVAPGDSAAGLIHSGDLVRDAG
ncbi:MAG: DUF6675 family protein [Pseudomonadota bacterium]